MNAPEHAGQDGIAGCPDGSRSALSADAVGHEAAAATAAYNARPPPTQLISHATGAAQVRCPRLPRVRTASGSQIVPDPRPQRQPIVVTRGLQPTNEVVNSLRACCERRRLNLKAAALA